MAVTDATGAVVETAEYEPYGGMRAHTGIEASNYKFTDQELDPETGLYNYDARLYDPDIGRFITPDTMIPDPFDPQMFDRYAYCRNNPLKYVDPNGHYGFSADGVSDCFSGGGWSGGADYGGPGGGHPSTGLGRGNSGYDGGWFGGWTSGDSRGGWEAVGDSYSGDTAPAPASPNIPSSNIPPSSRGYRRDRSGDAWGRGSNPVTTSSEGDDTPFLRAIQERGWMWGRKGYTFPDWGSSLIGDPKDCPIYQKSLKEIAEMLRDDKEKGRWLHVNDWEKIWYGQDYRFKK